MYKLINKQTGEEHICQKVTIDGMDYYVSDEIIGEDELFVMGNELVYNSSLITDEWCRSLQPKPIATNNPNIDVPKVVDEVWERAWKIAEQTGIKDEHQLIHLGTAWYDGHSTSQETHPFSEEDMIEFSQWVSKYDWVFMSNKDHWVNDDLSLHPKTTKELLQHWKEQQTKIVYYE